MNQKPKQQSEITTIEEVRLWLMSHADFLSKEAKLSYNSPDHQMTMIYASGYLTAIASDKCIEESIRIRAAYFRSERDSRGEIDY